MVYPSLVSEAKTPDPRGWGNSVETRTMTKKPLVILALAGLLSLGIPSGASADDFSFSIGYGSGGTYCSPGYVYNQPSYVYTYPSYSYSVPVYRYPRPVYTYPTYPRYRYPSWGHYRPWAYDGHRSYRYYRDHDRDDRWNRRRR